MLFENKTFTNLNLQHDHQGQDFFLKDKITWHKMIASKDQISVDKWRRIWQRMNEIELICEKAEECSNIEEVLNWITKIK